MRHHPPNFLKQELKALSEASQSSSALRDAASHTEVVNLRQTSNSEQHAEYASRHLYGKYKSLEHVVR